MSNTIKKCLLIGINYTGTSYQLNGCINDSHNIKIFYYQKDFLRNLNLL